MTDATVDRAQRLAQSRATARDRRSEFKARVVDMAGADQLPSQPMQGRLPDWALWTADSECVAAFVADGELARTADKALAYGLHHAKGRKLALVLPAGRERGSQIRAAFLKAPIEVRTQKDGQISDPLPLGEAAATERLREPKGLRYHPLSLDPPHREWVQDLLDWASVQDALSEASRTQYLAWHAHGMKILQIRRTAQTLIITAGIHYSSPSKRPLKVTLDRALTSSELEQITVAVQEAFAEAENRDAGPYEEHWLQDNLRRHRDRVGWPEPDTLLREFPARRPNGGSGFIDFLRYQPANRALHIVETKIGPDEFLVLQALDYWIWAQANRDLLEKRHDLGPIRSTTVDFILGAKTVESPRSTPLLSAYAASHLDLLPDAMTWQFHMAIDYNGPSIRIESLDVGQNPPPQWTRPE